MAAGNVALVICDIADSRIRKPVRCEEAPAAHAGIHIPFEFQGFLLGNVIRHHALRSALRREFGQVEVRRTLPDIVFLKHIDQFRKSRRDVDTAFVLDSENPLLQHHLDHDGEVIPQLPLRDFPEVQEYGHKRCLPVRGLQRDQLILNRLAAGFNLFEQFLLHQFAQLFGRHFNTGLMQFFGKAACDLLSADVNERGKMRHGDRLAAVLAGSNLRDDLGSDRTGCRKALRLVDVRSGDTGAVLQHILQVDEVAVVHMLGKIIRIMEMDNAALMGIDDFLGKQVTARIVTAPFTGHVISLHGEDGGILVAVLLLDFLIVALDDACDLLVYVAHLAHFIVLIAIRYVEAGYFRPAGAHESVFDFVLNLFDREIPSRI